MIELIIAAVLSVFAYYLGYKTGVRHAVSSVNAFLNEHVTFLSTEEYEAFLEEQEDELD